MSKSYETKVGGHKLVIQVPETVEEYDLLAKKSGATLEAAIDYEVYHHTLGDARKIFAKSIETTTGVKRREIGTGKFEEDDDGKKVEITKDEPFDTYITRAAAEAGRTGDEPFADLASALDIKFDPSTTERKPGTGPKLPKYAETNAINFIDGKTAPNGKVYSIHAFAKAFHKRMGKDLVLPTGADRAKDIQVLGRQLVEYQNAEDQFAKMSE